MTRRGTVGQRRGLAIRAMERPPALTAFSRARPSSVTQPNLPYLACCATLVPSDRPARQIVNPFRTARPAALALLTSLFFGCSADKAPAKDSTAAASHDMTGMAGMSGMDTPVTIPKGAIYTAADVHFMQGMIAHHAQAIFMSRLAASNGANARLLRFANKIDQSQTAEIRLMQEWLVANGQVAPDTSSYHTVMMAGMLSAEQIKTLEAARGAAFDGHFLTMMIQHHEGALKMVSELLASPGAAQDIDVSVFANDVFTVQTAEIGTMYQMLEQVPAKP